MRRPLLGIVSFVPALGILSLSAMFASSPALVAALEHLDYHALVALPTARYVALAIVLLVTVCIQIGLGVAAAFLLGSRTEISGEAKVGWPLGIVFFGSIAAPLFYFTVVPKLR